MLIYVLSYVKLQDYVGKTAAMTVPSGHLRWWTFWLTRNFRIVPNNTLNPLNLPDYFAKASILHVSLGYIGWEPWISHVKRQDYVSKTDNMRVTSGLCWVTLSPVNVQDYVELIFMIMLSYTESYESSGLCWVNLMDYVEWTLQNYYVELHCESSWLCWVTFWFVSPVKRQDYVVKSVVKCVNSGHLIWETSEFS